MNATQRRRLENGAAFYQKQVAETYKKIEALIKHGASKQEIVSLQLYAAHCHRKAAEKLSKLLERR